MYIHTAMHRPLSPFLVHFPSLSLLHISPTHIRTCTPKPFAWSLQSGWSVTQLYLELRRSMEPGIIKLQAAIGCGSSCLYCSEDKARGATRTLCLLTELIAHLIRPLVHYILQIIRTQHLYICNNTITI